MENQKLIGRNIKNIRKQPHMKQKDLSMRKQEIANLNWLLDKSMYLHNAVFNYANRTLVLDKEVIIYCMKIKEEEREKKGRKNEKSRKFR